MLDNVEHLMGSVPDLRRVLTGCRGLTALVTSRIVLGLRGEREVALAPLATPAVTDSTDVGSVQDSPAVQLLLARARDVRPSFAVTEANADAMAELSRRLDGIPLALELVAAQLRLMTPRALVVRLGDQRSRPLDISAGQVDVPCRQRTLRATIDWSHSLLSEAEKTLLARLSVLPSPWTLAAAEAVGSVDGDLDVLATLTSLASQSLVRADYGDLDESSFRMLETIRRYAGERLDARGDRDETMHRLADDLLVFVAGVSLALEGAGNAAAAQEVDRRIGDLRGTSAWAVAVHVPARRAAGRSRFGQPAEPGGRPAAAVGSGHGARLHR